VKRTFCALVLGAALVALLGACGAEPRTGQASPSSTPTDSPTPSASPSASPTGGTTASGLPVWGEAFVLQGNQAAGYSGGFIAIPGGKFTLAPETVTNLPPEQISGWTYSQVLGHWLPVRRQAVSPDGTQYAYVQYTLSAQVIHVVDGRTKADRVLVDSKDLDWPNWQTDGIYVDHHLIGSDFGRGLARVDVTTGSVTEIPVPPLTGGHSDWTVAGGVAWATDWTPGLPAQFGLNNRLQRYDLTTGHLATWFYDPNKNIALNGFSASFQPMVEIEDVSGNQLSNAVEATVSGPNTIAHPFMLPGMPTNSTLALDVMADGNQLWIAHVGGGVWRVPGGGAAEKLSDAPGVWGIGGVPMG
jgi:hypothetical protein